MLAHIQGLFCANDSLRKTKSVESIKGLIQCTCSLSVQVFSFPARFVNAKVLFAVVSDSGRSSVWRQEDDTGPGCGWPAAAATRYCWGILFYTMSKMVNFCMFCWGTGLVSVSRSGQIFIDSPSVSTIQPSTQRLSRLHLQGWSVGVFSYSCFLFF